MLFSSSESRRAISSRSDGSSTRCPSRSTATRLAAALVLLLSAAPVLAKETGSKPYTVITNDGHSIQAIAKPVVAGKRATLRLYPYGQPAFLPASAIDWMATDAYNQPKPEPAKPVRVDPTLELPQNLPQGVTRTNGMIELWMSGGGRSSKSRPAEKSAVTPAPVLPLVPKDPAVAAAQITALRNEMQTLRDLQKNLYDTKQKLGQEVARLEAATANDAPVSGVEVPKETPSQKELRRVRDDLKSTDDQIQAVDRRMNEIQEQAVDLGGSVD